MSVQFPLTSEPRLLTRDLDPAELYTLLPGQVIRIHSELRVSQIVVLPGDWPSDQADISNNADSVKLFLSTLLHTLPKVGLVRSL